jgi:hypothetical protein
MSVKKSLAISVIGVLILLFIVYPFRGTLAVEKKDNTAEINVKFSATDIANDKRSYNNFLDFPYYEGIEFVDEEIFETIKTAYEKIDFFAKFKKAT